MKSIFLALTNLFVLSCLAQGKQSHYKTQIDFGGGTVISTFMDLSLDKQGFVLTSPKNADVRLFGGKAKLGRLMGKSPKKGIIIKIEGNRKNDSLFGETSVPMFGKLKFKGLRKHDSFDGIFVNADNREAGSLHGVVSAETRNNYEHLYPKLLSTIRKNIYSTDALKSPQWIDFQSALEELCKTAHDDIEMFMGFNIMSQNLPFSHLTLLIVGGVEEIAAEEPATEEFPVDGPASPSMVIFEEKDIETAYVQIKNFSSTADELMSVMPKIVQNQNYKNLIVDLRDNPGGGIDAAFAFAEHITDSDMEVGYFPTNKLKYSGYQREVFATLPDMQPKSTNEFGQELRKTKGVKLIYRKPLTPVFGGKLYILTNGGTGSTCEPIVYALKKSKKAMVIGEKTAGAMLAGSAFVVEGKFTLMVPIGDFYTMDGNRLDRVGVSPDVEVKSDDALTRAMEIISNGKI